MRLDLYKSLVADNVGVGQDEIVPDDAACPAGQLRAGSVPGIVLVGIAMCRINLDDGILDVLTGRRWSSEAE